jgi:hypothetical protein
MVLPTTIYSSLMGQLLPTMLLIGGWNFAIITSILLIVEQSLFIAKQDLVELEL